MTLLFAGFVIVGVAAVAVAAMLFVRRTAPEGSYFADGDRAAGVFGVIATGFAVLLGFVVFLAFESYDTSRSGAETEAQIVAHQFQTAQLLPKAVRQPMSDELVCYARNVVYQEWPQMESTGSTALINPWTVAMFRILETVEPRQASEAYSKWLDERSDRQAARGDRLHGAEGVIPAPLWIVLFLSAGVIFVFMLFFADSGERKIVQGAMMGGVALVVTSMLVLLWFLNTPYHSGIGGLRPTAMQRTLKLFDVESKLLGVRLNPPCDARGVAKQT
jgi:hypothetical protein